MEKKVIDLNKTIYELCTLDPQIPQVLESLGFKDIIKPGMIATAGRFMTIPKGAAMKKIDLEVIKQELRDCGYELAE